MKSKRQAPLMCLAILMCFLIMTGQAVAARKIAQLDEQPRTLNFSKAVPDQLNYQGFLADAADSAAVTATLGMTFRLFDSESKGAELWSETHPTVDVNNGLFHVLLGSVTPLPPGLFDGTPMWLQTEVGVEIFSPRKPLVSVAYSHRSNSAEKLLDLTLMDLDDRWVNEGQIDAVTSDMIVDGHGSGLDADMVDGQHAADFVGAADLNHLDAADGDPANAVYVDNGGRVGIGTTTPARNLHIYDDADNVAGIDIENPNTGSNSIEMVTFTDENGGLAGIATYDDGSIYSNAMRIYNNRPNGTLGLLTSGLERIRINNDGKVGIGKTTPSYTLDVNGAVNAATYWGDGSNLSGIAGAPDADWTIAGSDMYSGVAGNVGIGTATPGYPLHVYRYAAYSPAYAGYFNAVGHEATGNAYAVYADASADDENAYGIYSTAASTWGEAYAGYFDGNVKADSIFLGSSSKVGQDGGLLLYNDGLTNPVVELGQHFGAGGKVTLRDTSGSWHNRLEPDINGSGGFLAVYRNAGLEGFMVDGNSGGTEEPFVAISGSARSATFYMNNSDDASVMLPSSAISAGEIKDEPGVSNSLGTDYVFMTVGNYYVIDSVDIDIPAAGYVEVTGGCYLNLYHIKGSNTAVWVSLDKTPQNAHFNIPGSQLGRIPDSTATSGTSWMIPCTPTRLYEEVSAGPKRYYLNAYYYDGVSSNTNVAWGYIRVKYYPTLYGTVTLADPDGIEPALSSSRDPGDGSVRGQEPPRRSITVEDHNARLEAEMAALRAELEALKEEVHNQR